MKLRMGKIGRNVLDRSVFKRIQGPRQTEDCVLLEDGIAVTADPITLRTSRIGELAVYAAIGDLSAAGAEPLSFSPVILLPPDTEESLLREIMDQIGETCHKTGLAVRGGHTEVTPAVNRPVVTGTASGRLRKKDAFHPGPGTPVFMTKWAGLEGTYLLAAEKEKELLSRFPASMVARTKRFREWLGTAEESAAALGSGNCLMHDLSEGGIFAALWSFADMTGAGLDIDLKQIPLRQETIEYTDYFGINPYQMESAGSLLIAPEDPEALMREMDAAGIPCGVIGTLTGDRARILRNGEDVRYLDLPGPDSLIGILGN